MITRWIVIGAISAVLHATATQSVLTARPLRSGIGDIPNNAAGRLEIQHRSGRNGDEPDRPGARQDLHGSRHSAPIEVRPTGRSV